MVKQVLNKYNTAAVVAFNTRAGANVPLTERYPCYEDFISVHSKKLGSYLHYYYIKNSMVTSLEGAKGIIDSKSLGHFVMTTLQDTYNSMGNTPKLHPAWEHAQAVEWMNCTVTSNGTW